MKEKSNRNQELTDFSKHNKKELAEAFVFPSKAPETLKERKEEESFWLERRKQFKNRTSQHRIYDSLLQLKFQLEDYINSNEYKDALSFSYFLAEYVNRQGKKDKDFAAEIDITPAALSQYINNYRKPPEKIVYRLELHSNGMIPAIAWYKLLQKDKEYAIVNDAKSRREENRHIKNKLEFSFD